MNKVEKSVPRSVIATVVVVAVLLAGVWLVPIAPKVVKGQAAEMSYKITLYSKGLSTAEWTTEEKVYGDYSAKLIMPAGTGWVNDNAEVQIKILDGILIKDINTFSYWIIAPNGYTVPIEFHVDTDGKGTIDKIIIGQKTGATSEDWLKVSESSLNMYMTWKEGGGFEWLSTWEKVQDKYGEAKLLEVHIGYGSLGSNIKVTAYVDDFTLNDTIYSIEPQPEPEPEPEPDTEPEPEPEPEAEEPTPTPPGAITPVSDRIVNDAIREAEETGEVVIEVPEEEIALTVDQLKKIADTDKPVVIKTDKVEFVLPPEIVADLSEIDAVQIEIMAKEIAEDEAPTPPSGFKLAGEVFELTIVAVDKEGNRHEISSFAKLLRIAFPVPPSAKDAAASGKLDVYRYEEEAKIWEAMGGTYDDATNTIIFTTDRLSKYALMEKTAPPIKTFVDIKGHWAQSDIELMASLGIVRGISEDYFAPEMPVNRAQFAAFLIRSLDIEEVTPVTPHFEDVQPDAWYYGAVEGAYAAGLIKGYEDGTFRPEHEISREEMTALIARALKNAGQQVVVDDVDAILARFVDANEISSWAKEEAAQAVASGIIIGRNGSFAPKDNATRAEAVVVVKRMLVKLGVI